LASSSPVLRHKCLAGDAIMLSFILKKDKESSKKQAPKSKLLNCMRYSDNYSITDANFDCNQDATSQTLHMGVSPNIIKTQMDIN